MRDSSTHNISVIIPVYNAERYLKRCLDSVLGQSFSQIEIVLVDDGSTDGSGQMCDEYALKDERVRVLHQCNQGASLARKTGLRESQGEYVTFVDSDDWIDMEYLSTLYEMLVKYHVSVSACGVLRVNVGEELFKEDNEYEINLMTYEELMPRFFKYEFWGFWGKLYKKDILINLVFPEATLSEDYYVMAQLFLLEHKMVYTNNPLYCFEYHPTSLSHQKLSKRSFEEFENVKAVYELMKVRAPQYSDMALANVVETCVKLHLMVLHEKRTIDYLQEYQQIYTFLKQHFWIVINCGTLSWKTKMVVVGLVHFPLLTAKLI